jgi:hypothetical protein
MISRKLVVDIGDLPLSSVEEIQDMIAGYTPRFEVCSVSPERYICFREQDWKHLADRINWAQSFLDAEAVTIMNEPRKQYLLSKE